MAIDLKAIRERAKKYKDLEPSGIKFITDCNPQTVIALLDHIKTLTDTLQEIKECTELFYDGKWLKPGLSPYAGPINVICKVTDSALKAGATSES